MGAYNSICLLLIAGVCIFAFYLCNSYRKMWKASHRRWIETWGREEHWKEFYEAEKRKNQVLEDKIDEMQRRIQ